MKLYHGSPRKLKALAPKKARSAKNKAGNQVAVYATERKDFAIVMSLLHQKGVGKSRINFPRKKAIGTIFEGWPIQKYFYLYTLNSKDFKRIPRSPGEWISKEKINFLEIEKLKTDDYIHLLRKGTKKEFEKYKNLVKKFKEKQK